MQQGYLLHLAGGNDVAKFLIKKEPFMLNALDSVGLEFEIKGCLFTAFVF